MLGTGAGVGLVSGGVGRVGSGSGSGSGASDSSGPDWERCYFRGGAAGDASVLRGGSGLGHFRRAGPGFAGVLSGSAGFGWLVSFNMFMSGWAKINFANTRLIRIFGKY